MKSRYRRSQQASRNIFKNMLASALTWCMLLAVKEIGRFYVYALVDPRNERVFYIGKGKGNRSQMHLYKSVNYHRTNPKLYNKIRKILKTGSKYQVEFLFSSNNEQECLRKEMEWIGFYGLASLCNLTNGERGNKRIP